MRLYVNIEKQLKDFKLKVDFEASENTLGLLGESGSGKSMTLKCIAGLITPDKGKILINDKVLFDSDEHINIPIRKRKIGFLFQNYALFPHLTVSQNISYGLFNRSKEERDNIIGRELKRVHIESLKDKYPSQLSGGQQQRAALSRALAVEPEILLLDEPFSALDNHLRNELIKQMKETLSTYHGISIFVSHNMEEAYEVCEDLIILSAGRKDCSGNKRILFRSPPTMTAAKLTGCKNISSFTTIDSKHIEVKEWQCQLQLKENLLSAFSYVGIQAHHLKLTDKQETNTFDCYPVYFVETPSKIIVYLSLHNEPRNNYDYNLQWEISSEQWAEIKDKPSPYKIKLEAERLIFMES